MQAYEDEKMRLFAPEICPIAVVNADDEMGRRVGERRENSGLKTVFYGLKSPADCFAVITDERICGAECMLNINDRLCRIKLPMPGKHNVYNALAAAVCATELGIGTDAVFQGLNGLEGVEGRLQRVATYERADVFVDFAHTPDGLKKSIETLKKHCRGRLICLFGCGGNRDKSKRPIMGETVAKTADFAVITSDNPRFEDPLDIISDIEKGFRRFSARYVVVPDRKRALEYALDTLQRGDVLLVAGKGGERYQEIMGIKYPFNDQDIIEKLIEQKGKNPFV
jgi:UDP-N-acetylmuramyl-tripeptide synthetase